MRREAHVGALNRVVWREAGATAIETKAALAQRRVSPAQVHLATALHHANVRRPASGFGSAQCGFVNRAAACNLDVLVAVGYLAFDSVQ